jgi:hypothetical protein
LELISNIAVSVANGLASSFQTDNGMQGVDLVPLIDYEIGHINISVPGSVKMNDAGDLVAEDQNPVVDWHRDSYPFVCVLMMSDVTGMIGGETALKTGTGDIKKVRGPEKVFGILQSRGYRI